jgi:histidine ammonia-lyase
MKNISLKQFEEFVLGNKTFDIDENVLMKVNDSFQFLQSFSSDKVIYGINTGFGPMAQYKIGDKDLNNLQYNLVRSHCSGSGKPISSELSRAVLFSRLVNFLQAKSGVSPEVITRLQLFVNKKINPEIFEHGGVGASGDLVQLAHLALNLIGEGYVYLDGQRTPTSKALNQKGIAPLGFKLRDGLGIMNGTSCMTGIGAVNTIYSHKIFEWSVVASSIINEITNAFDDSFSEGLNFAKQHKGQHDVANMMREYLHDSDLIVSRQDLYSDSGAKKQKVFEKKIQEYYSIRCVPQILGPILDTIRNVEEVVINELNSTNDNPVVDAERGSVFHGGNFHGDYVSLEMDKLRIVLTKLSMLMERQLNYLLNSKINNQFPPFLNLGELGLNFGIQGLQFTATSTTSENQTLSLSSYIHSIPNNNDNQDVVSMGTNSSLITNRVVNNTFEVMSIHFIALLQAIDCLPNQNFDKLSSKTKELYKYFRAKFDSVVDDKVQYENISVMVDLLKNKKEIL